MRVPERLVDTWDGDDMLCTRTTTRTKVGRAGKLCFGKWFLFLFFGLGQALARAVARRKHLTLAVRFPLAALESMFGLQSFCNSQRCLFGYNLEVSCQSYPAKT